MERLSKEGADGRVGNVIKSFQRVLIKSISVPKTASKGLWRGKKAADNRLGPST